MTTAVAGSPQQTHPAAAGSAVLRLLPGLAAYTVMVVLLHVSGVGVEDSLRYTVGVVLGLTVPGTVVWRLLALDRDGASLLEDLVLGTGIAYPLCLGSYLVLGAAGAPGLILAWPLLPILVSVHPRLRARVWRRAPVRLPAWYGGACATLVAAAAVVLAHSAWRVDALSGRGLRSLYLDLPYHLSLITGLARGVPSDLPFLQGEPLYYHWFVHAQIAAETHLTGVDPLVLLIRLSLLPMVVVLVLGTALIALRLGGSPVASLIAPAVLVLGQSAAIWPGDGAATIEGLIYHSPTMTYADVLLVPFAALALRLLRPGPCPAVIWPALVVVIGALSGAKGSALPVLVGAWLLVVLADLVLHRRLHRRALGGLAVTIGWLMVARSVVYGGSAQGLLVRPFRTGADLAVAYGVVPDVPSAGPVLSAGALLVFVAVALTGGAGLVPLVVIARRDPRAALLVGWVLAGLAALTLFYADALNQFYFLFITPVALAIGSAWGASLLWHRVAPRQAGTTVAAGVAVGFAVGAVTRGRPIGIGDGSHSFVVVLVAPALLALAAGAGAVGLRWWGRRRREWRGTAPLAVIALLVGLCLPISTLTILETLAHPARLRPGIDPDRPIYTYIAPGGIRAARWLHAHSAADAVVATNVHCLVVTPAGTPCDRRVAWVSAFTGRQVLVEGWAYTSQSALRAEEAGTAVRTVPFWRPRLLSANDAAIAAPTAARLARLHSRFGVDWLFIDKRFPHDLPALRRLGGVAEVAYDRPGYAVVRIG